MTPEQALAYIEQERLDVLVEGHTEEECNRIAAYVLASAYRRLLASRPEAVAHSDHPLQHWDRTCQACIADPVPTKAHIVYCYQHVRDCLKELLRLYDWRNELGGIERDFNHDKKQMSRWLNQYGREKKQAWFVARELLDGGRKTPDFAPSPLVPITPQNGEQR